MNHPRHLRDRPSSSAGFSLIEMLTTMSVLVVLLVIASPGLASLTSANAASAAQSELLAAMTLARGEAIKRSVQVGIAAGPVASGRSAAAVAAAATGSTDFSGGWTVFVDADGNGRYDAGETIVRQQPAFPGNVAVTALPSPSAIVFNGRGFLVPSNRITINVCSPDAVKGYQVRVEPVGLADVAETAGCT